MHRFFYLTVLLFIFSSSYAQGVLNKRVSIDEQNKSIEYILDLLESDEMRFTYSSDLFDVKKRVSIKAKNRSISEVLDELFAGQSVELMTLGDQVIIKKKRIGIVNEEVAKVQVLATSSLLQDTAAVIMSAVQVTTDSLSVEPEGKEQAIQKPLSQDTTLSSIGSGAIVAGGSGGDVLQNERNEPAELPSIGFSFTPQIPQYTYYRRAVFRNLPMPVVEQKVSKRAFKAPKVKPEKELFSTDGIHFSASLYTSMTQLSDQTGILMGGRGLYYLTPHLGVGIGGAGFLTARIRDENLDGDYRITGGYGGLMAEYTFRPMNKFHFNYHLLVAGGGTVYFREGVITGIQPTQLKKGIFVLEPGITAEYHVIKWFRIGLDLTYRYNSAGTINYPNSDQLIFTTESLRSFNLGVNLKFGRFQ